MDFGHEVTGLASSGTEAIANAEQTHADLALMDVRIKGDMDGTEIARVLRERFIIPVVYLTAHADRETLGRAKGAEPLGYLVKPFQEPMGRSVEQVFALINGESAGPVEVEGKQVGH